MSFKCLLCIPLVAVCLPLSGSVFSSVLPPLVTSPGLFPPISPHLFLVSLLVSVYLVSPFPLVFVSSLPLFLLLSVSVSVGVIVPQWYVFFVVVFLDCEFWFSHICFVLCLFLCTLNCFILLLCLAVVLLLWFFVLVSFSFHAPFCFLLPSAFVLIKAHPLFSLTPASCLGSTSYFLSFPL